MKLVSVQSITGGTGVSTTAFDFAVYHRNLGDRVLAIDLCPQGEFHSLLKEERFCWLDDNRPLFESPGIRLRRDNEMPKHAYIADPNGLQHYYSVVKDSPVFSITGRHKEVKNLVANLDTLGNHYDICIVDIPKASRDLMRMFYDQSDQIILMVRDNGFSRKTEDVYRDEIIARSGRSRPPQIMMLQDRQNLRRANSDGLMSLFQLPIKKDHHTISKH